LGGALAPVCGMGERMTRVAAARALGVNKATVTKWVQKHPALLGDDGLLDLDELKAHRAQVVDQRLATSGRAAAGSEMVEDRRPSSRASANDFRARTEAAKAEAAELDLAERLGRTLRRDEVESAIADAVTAMADTAATLARERAERLARIGDVREMEAALTALTDEMRDRLSERLASMAQSADAPETADVTPGAERAA